jgi:hypothetical protein
MNHDEAIQDGATERYVLDDMTNEERDAFEEHYFDCAVCAEDVKAAIAIRDEGMAYVDQQIVEPVDVQPPIPFPPRQRRLPASLAAAASAMIAVVSMYAGVVQPKQKQLAEALTPFVTDGKEHKIETTRGSEELAVLNHRDSTVLLIDLETDDESPRYNFVAVDSAGRQQFTVPVDGARARATKVPLAIRGGTLKPGNYTLRVDGTEAGVATYRFAVR